MTPQSEAIKMQYLNEYNTFDSVQELNYHVKQHTNKRYYDMNETQRKVLQLISQYSVKHIGASHLKVDTIAGALSKSSRTIIRAIKSLVALKVIEKLKTTRRISGGQGANIYRILPYVMAKVSERESVAEPTQAKDSTPLIAKETAILLSDKDISTNTYLASRNTSNKRPYSRFKDAITTHIGKGTEGDKRMTHRLYGVYLAQTKALRKAYATDELIDIAIESIRYTFQATKRNNIRNIAGYYNGVLSNMLDDLCTYETAKLFA